MFPVDFLRSYSLHYLFYLLVATRARDIKKATPLTACIWLLLKVQHQYSMVVNDRTGWLLKAVSFA
jgi:hypothetical protein